MQGSQQKERLAKGKSECNHKGNHNDCQIQVESDLNNNDSNEHSSHDSINNLSEISNDNKLVAIQQQLKTMQVEMQQLELQLKNSKDEMKLQSVEHIKQTKQLKDKLKSYNKQNNKLQKENKKFAQLNKQFEKKNKDLNRLCVEMKSTNDKLGNDLVQLKNEYTNQIKMLKKDNSLLQEQIKHLKNWNEKQHQFSHVEIDFNRFDVEIKKISAKIGSILGNNSANNINGSICKSAVDLLTDITKLQKVFDIEKKHFQVRLFCMFCFLIVS